MSNLQIFSELPDSNERQKGAASGQIKGRVENLKTGKVYEFKDPWIWRDTQGGTLRFHGVVDDPELLGKRVAIGLQLDSASQEDGEFQVGDKRILDFGYNRYGEHAGFYAAESGSATIQRQAGDRINGAMKFITRTNGQNQYKVDVIYDIGAP